MATGDVAERVIHRESGDGDLRDEETMHGLAGPENSLCFVGLIGDYEVGLRKKRTGSPKEP